MAKGKARERPPNGEKSKAVSGWARATEYIAKALTAVVGLVLFVFSLRRR